MNNILNSTIITYTFCITYLFIATYVNKCNVY